MSDLNELLQTIYYSTSQGLFGRTALHQRAKAANPKITYKIVDEFLKKQEPVTLRYDYRPQALMGQYA